MKECRYCGTKYDDSLDVCPNCGGNKVITEEERAEEAALRQKEAENQERAAAAPVKKKNTIIGVIVAVVVVIAAIAGFSVYKANQPLSNGMTKDEAQGVFDSGVAFMDAGQYEDAIDTFLQLPSDSKKYAEAQELLTQSQDSYRTDIISRVDSQVANGDYDSAFSLIEKAQTIIPGDAELQGAYDNTYAAYRTAVLAKADEYSQSGQYKMALEYLVGVQTTFADDAQIQDSYDNINLAYKEQVRTTALTDADNYVASADYVSAINTLNSAIDEIGQDEEVTAKLNIISNDYATSVIDAAKAQYIEYNADSIFAAEDMIGQALGVLPGNEALSGELTFYEDHEPIPVLPIAKVSGSFATKQSATDNMGNTYSDVIYVESFAWTGFVHGAGYVGYNGLYRACYMDIKCDYQYTKITGVFFQSEEYANAPVDSEFTISGYEDEDRNEFRAIVLSKNKMTGGNSPIFFEADVTNRDNITLYFLGDTNASEENEPYNYAYIAQLYLWK